MTILAKEDSAREETTRGYKAFKGFVTRTNIPALQKPEVEEKAQADQSVQNASSNNTQNDQSVRRQY